jgi:hypothetical protein
MVDVVRPNTAPCGPEKLCDFTLAWISTGPNSPNTEEFFGRFYALMGSV